MIEIIHSPLIISNLESFNQSLKSFVIQIREKGSNKLLVNTDVGATKKGLKWVSDSYVYKEAIKGTTYQVRVATKDLSGNTSAFTAWVNEVAGDDSFGSGHSWTNSIASRSTCVELSVQLNSPPPDFERIEIYVRSASGTSGHESWVPEYIMTETSFNYPWVGDRGVTKYFYAKAFDTSGNASAIVSVGSGKIQEILPGDMDTTPPTASTVTATLDS